MSGPSFVRRSAALVVAAVLLAPAACASDPIVSAAHADDVRFVADPILVDEYQEHIDLLASDMLEGRETGTRGEQRAAAYIIAMLEELPRIEPAGDDGGWFQTFPVTGTKDIESGRNVLARISGSDPALAHEAIVLGAHYDHVGFGRHGNSLDMGGPPLIHNGADDNASGTAGLLEIAAALATAPTPPRRTILIQWYSGEELGLLGSRHWVANPLHPLDDVVAMINCDMIGRPVGRTLLVGGTGTSPIWNDMLAELRLPHGLELVYDPTGIAPSDNSSFYEKDIPVLFFFSGVHEDYHRPTDDAGKIHADAATRVVRLVHDVIRDVDARPERPPFTPALGSANYYMPTVVYGMVLDPVGSGVPGTATIAVLEDDTPAAEAGLREGDVLFLVDKQEPEGYVELKALLKTTDDLRRPHSFVVWRAKPGVAAPNPERTFTGSYSQWAAAFDWHEVSLRPVVR